MSEATNSKVNEKIDKTSVFEKTLFTTLQVEKIVLSWKINMRGQMTTVCASYVDGLISFSEGQESTIHMMVFNSNNRVTTITPRLAAICIFDLDECMLKCL